MNTLSSLSEVQQQAMAEIGDMLAVEFGRRCGWDPTPALNIFRAHLQPRTVIVR